MSLEVNFEPLNLLDLMVEFLWTLQLGGRPMWLLIGRFCPNKEGVYFSCDISYSTQSQFIFTCCGDLTKI